MIILLGPDGTGKSTLANKIFEGNCGYTRVDHFTKGSKYDDYIEPLSSGDLVYAVLDRFMLCEPIYAEVMHRQMQYSVKQFHNTVLMGLAFNPLIVLCTHKPSVDKYDESQYLPYDKWDDCLKLYRKFLDASRIQYITWDYELASLTPNRIVQLDEHFIANNKWWKTELFDKGIFSIGSQEPQLALVGERMGPNNMHNLPFETGPTGHMLSNLIDKLKIPLGSVAITNLIKDERGATRDANVNDLKLLEEELQSWLPSLGTVVFMGSVARKGVAVAKGLGIDYHCISHPGSFYHKTRLVDLATEKFIQEWTTTIGRLEF